MKLSKEVLLWKFLHRCITILYEMSISIRISSGNTRIILQKTLTNFEANEGIVLSNAHEIGV